METSVLIVLACGVVAMIVGSVWYGPLFGKKWMEVIGVDPHKEITPDMKKAAMPLYLIQFLLTALQVYILSNLINYTGGNGVWVAGFMWLGFVMPTIAGCSMWNNNSNRLKWSQFLIQSGYQLIVFVLFGYILGTWG